MIPLQNSNKSVWALLLSNLVTIVIALIQKWDLGPLLVIYWAQSVIIGISNWRRILNLKRFSGKRFADNRRSVETDKSKKRFIAVFFLFHYGFFHAIYFVFLSDMVFPLSNKIWVGITICVLGFAFNHYFSYRQNLERDSARVPNLGTVMFFPYARILPMHLTIIFAGKYAEGSIFVLLIFLVLKTIADVVMHLIEHSKLK